MQDWEDQVKELVEVLKNLDIEPVLAPHIFRTKDDYSGTDKERAEDLMRFYADDEIDAIYDISGGDLANGVLKYLDYDLIARKQKTYWGYSDLTTIINAIYKKTGRPSVLYQVKNMVWDCAVLQQKRFADLISEKNYDLFDINYKFLQGSAMEGVLAGGNIRCLTKLAGTSYWPDMKGKVLFLEALSGECGPIATLFNQLDDMGVFDEVTGILLGTFTRYEEAELQYSVFDLLKMHISDELPVACTSEIGHGQDSKALLIGAGYKLREDQCVEIDQDALAKAARFFLQKG